MTNDELEVMLEDIKKKYGFESFALIFDDGKCRGTAVNCCSERFQRLLPEACLNIIRGAEEQKTDARREGLGDLMKSLQKDLAAKLPDNADVQVMAGGLDDLMGFVDEITGKENDRKADKCSSSRAEVLSIMDRIKDGSDKEH